MGILILAVALLPLLGVGGSQLFRAEAAGPIKDTKLTPRMTGTAKGLWGVYSLFSIACSVAFWLGGMAPLDALMHMFATVSLGRAVLHDASFGLFRSPLLEGMRADFYAAGQLQFCAVLYCAAQRQLAQPVARPGDAGHHWRAAGRRVVGGAAAVGQRACTDRWRPCAMACSTLVSVATTTGFATTDYLTWPVFAPVLMLLLSGCGHQCGLYGGGIKMMRMLILFQQARREMTRLVHPRAVQPVVVGGKVIDAPDDFCGAGLYAGLRGHHHRAQHGAVADRFGPLHRVLCRGGQCALHWAGAGGLGASVQLRGAYGFSDLGVHLGMLLGRLEILSFMALLTPAFWRR